MAGIKDNNVCRSLVWKYEKYVTLQVRYTNDENMLYWTQNIFNMFVFIQSMRSIYSPLCTN